ncbi:31 kDa ribonucleoprotein, chloroplastic [Linum perenne]
MAKILASSSTFTHASMAKSCFFSRPSFFTCSRTPDLSLSVLYRTFSLHFSHSQSLKPTAINLHFSSLIPFVSQTSDWDEPNANATITDSVVGSWDNEGEEPETDEDGDFDESGGEGDLAQDAKLFVGNLPYDVDSEQMAKLFQQAGTVEIAEVIYDRQSDSSRGFGFVTMSTVEEADNAIVMFHRYDMEGRLLTVNKASPMGKRIERGPSADESSLRVYVGNLPWSIDDARLQQVFSEHGKVMSAQVIYDRESGRSRGFGFVTMADESEMNNAIAALDGQSLDGRAIRVNVAEERPRRLF